MRLEKGSMGVLEPVGAWYQPKILRLVHASMPNLSTPSVRRGSVSEALSAAVAPPESLASDPYGGGSQEDERMPDVSSATAAPPAASWFALMSIPV